MAGTITIGGMAAGLTSGEKVIGPLSIPGTAVIGQVSDFTLASGDTTVPVPSGAVAFVFVPPVNFSGSIKYRSTYADIGSYISPANPSVISFDAVNTPTNLYFHASTSSSSFAEITFI